MTTFVRQLGNMTNESTSIEGSNSEKSGFEHVITAATFSGPLPPPKVLEDYNRIVPGAANRILILAEKQSEHRRHIEAMFGETEVRNSRLGILCGLLVGLSGIAAATIIAVYGNPRAGVGMGLLTLGSLVSIFVYGSRSRRKQMQENWDRLARMDS